MERANEDGHSRERCLHGRLPRIFKVECDILRVLLEVGLEPLQEDFYLSFAFPSSQYATNRPSFERVKCNQDGPPLELGPPPFFFVAAALNVPSSVSTAGGRCLTGRVPPTGERSLFSRSRFTQSLIARGVTSTLCRSCRSIATRLAASPLSRTRLNTYVLTSSVYSVSDGTSGWTSMNRAWHCLAFPRDLFVPEDPLDAWRAEVLHVVILMPAADNLVAAAGDTFFRADIFVRDHLVLGVRDGRGLLILHRTNSGPKSLNSSDRAVIQRLTPSERKLE